MATDAREDEKGLIARGRLTVDRVFPPEKRSELEDQLRSFAASRPRLTVFLATNITLTGLPLLLFLAFTMTIFISSLVVSILLGLLSAFLVTGFCVGLAMLVTIPIIFMTTVASMFIFTWAMACYYLVNWYNTRNSQSPHSGEAIKGKPETSSGRRDSTMNGDRIKKEEGQGASEDGTPLVNGSEQETVGNGNMENSSHIP